MTAREKFDKTSKVLDPFGTTFQHPRVSSMSKGKRKKVKYHNGKRITNNS